MPSFTHILVHSAGVLSLTMCVAPHIESVTTPVSDCCCANAANVAATVSMSTAVRFVLVFISISPCDLDFFIEPPGVLHAFPATRCSIFYRIIRLQTQSPPPQCTLLHKRKEDGHQNQHMNGGGDHAADERRGNRFHDIGTDAALPQDRDETGEHHTYGHEFRTKAMHGAFDDCLLNVFMLQRFSAREASVQRFVEVYDHDDAGLDRDAEQRDIANPYSHAEVVTQQLL